MYFSSFREKKKLECEIFVMNKLPPAQTFLFNSIPVIELTENHNVFHYFLVYLISILLYIKVV